jgi:hypothetical protein
LFGCFGLVRASLDWLTRFRSHRAVIGGVGGLLLLLVWRNQRLGKPAFVILQIAWIAKATFRNHRSSLKPN